MWLINTTTLKLEEFIGEDIPEYAILSHRWRAEEVLFHEIDTPTAYSKKGYAKIKATCQRAKDDGIGYAWIDTCCIDKKSSAELSEAINSMYQWYAKSKVCYAYLDDVVSERNLHKSEWFTRGWTLQELIAPSSLLFLTSKWEELGNKEMMSYEIAYITGIERAVLTGNTALAVSVAKRMSWASKRRTTRVEDRAYSLMGLFDVNMPLLYGEGEKAFMRLQEEIMRRSDDESLFAWDRDEVGHSGLLASTPDRFAACKQMVSLYRNPDTPVTPSSMTNMGVAIRLPISLYRSASAADTYVASLRCLQSAKNYHRMVVFLTPLFLPHQLVFARAFTGQSSEQWASQTARHRIGLESSAREYNVFICAPAITSFQTYPALTHNEFRITVAKSPGFPRIKASHKGKFIFSLTSSMGCHVDNERSSRPSCTIQYPLSYSGALATLRSDDSLLDSRAAQIRVGLDQKFNPVINIELHVVGRVRQLHGPEIIPPVYDGLIEKTREGGSSQNSLQWYVIHGPACWYLGLNVIDHGLSNEPSMRCYISELDAEVCLTRSLAETRKRWDLDVVFYPIHLRSTHIVTDVASPL
jgi:hypothetical protein